MKDHISKGDTVTWEWGSLKAFGEVVDTFTNRHIHSNSFPVNNRERSGHTDEKALLIALPDGRKILKMESEVDRFKDPHYSE